MTATPWARVIASAVCHAHSAVRPVDVFDRRQYACHRGCLHAPARRQRRVRQRSGEARDDVLRLRMPKTYQFQGAVHGETVFGFGLSVVWIKCGLGSVAG